MAVRGLRRFTSQLMQHGTRSHPPFPYEHGQIHHRRTMLPYHSLSSKTFKQSSTTVILVTMLQQVRVLRTEPWLIAVFLVLIHTPLEIRFAIQLYRTKDGALRRVTLKPDGKLTSLCWSRGVAKVKSGSVPLIALKVRSDEWINKYSRCSNAYGNRVKRIRRGIPPVSYLI